MEPTDQRFLNRVDGLRDQVEAVQGKLWAQDDVLLRLRTDAAALGAGYRSLQERAAAALEALKTAVPVEPKSGPAQGSADVQLPELSPELLRRSMMENLGARVTAFYDDAPAPGRSARLWLPYAALALAGVAASVGLPRLYAKRAPVLPPPAPEPLRSVLPIDFSARSEALPGGEVDRKEVDEVLRLVYDYVPAGSRRAVRELLRARIADAAQNDQGAPWIIERTDSGRFLVTLRPGAAALSAPLYEFEVDPARGSVQPSLETQADLQAAPRLADRG